MLSVCRAAVLLVPLYLPPAMLAALPGQTALTGQLLSPQGTGLNGQLQLSISKNVAQIVAAGCFNASGLISPNAPVRVQVINGNLQGSPAVADNACVSPPLTYYSVRFTDNNGNVLFTDYWVLTGASVDVGTIVSASVNGTAFQLGGASLATLINGKLPLSAIPTGIPASYINGLNELTIYNVNSFGAHHDGFTDDSAAFQGAAAAAELAGGGSVYIPCGAYAISSGFAIKSPSVAVMGAGSGCVTINYSGTNATFLTVQMNPFTISPAGEFSGFTIQGNASANAVGIRTGSTVGAQFRDISIHNFSGAQGTGFLMENIQSSNGGGINGSGWFERNVIERVEVYNCTFGYRTIINGGTNSFAYNTFEQIAFNTVAGQSGWQITGNGSGGPNGTGPYVYHNFIRGVYNGNGGTGIWVTGGANVDQNSIAITGEGVVGSGTVGIAVDSNNQFIGYGYFEVSNASFTNLNGVMTDGNPRFSIMPSKIDSTQDGGQIANFNGTSSTATLYPLNIFRGSPSVLGYSVGPNISGVFATLFNTAGSEFDIMSLNFGQALNQGTKVASIDSGGTAYFNGFGLFGVPLASFNSNFRIDLAGGINMRACQNTVGAGGVLNMGGCTTAGRSGLFNAFASSITGINENLGFGDTNWEAGIGSVIDANVAHPIAWGYSIDPVLFEWYAKPFQQALTAPMRSAYLTNAGIFVGSGFGTSAGNGVDVTCGGGTPYFKATQVSGGIIIAGICANF